MAGGNPPEGTVEVVSLESVDKEFGADGLRGDPLVVLENVTFTVRAGEFVSLVGPPGCGKSTVLNLLVGLARASAGSVFYRGQPLPGLNREIGYITQDDNLASWRTILGNVEFGPEIRGLSRRGRRDRAREFLELVGLGGFENHYPHELSAGLRRRASIVRTLVYDNPVVLMDEPFDGLDAQTRVALQEELLRLWERRRPAVLFATHEPAEAIALSDRILILTGRPGRITQEYVVRLPRPRDVHHIRELARFQELHTALRADLRDERPTAVLAEGLGELADTIVADPY